MYIVIYLSLSHMLYITHTKLNLDLWILLFKKFPSTSYGTPSPYPWNQGINLPSWVSPYLRASGFVMNLHKVLQNYS